MGNDRKDRKKQEKEARMDEILSRLDSIERSVSENKENNIQRNNHVNHISYR